MHFVVEVFTLFLLLPLRYVDIAEAIDTADPSLLDSSEFSETDAVPPIENLPKNHYLSDEVCFNCTFSIIVYATLSGFARFHRMTAKRFVLGCCRS